MTVYCYDTEFLEDGSTINLISIGIVCEDGREYYAVNSDMDAERINRDVWLMKKVWPLLPLKDYGLDYNANFPIDLENNPGYLDRTSLSVKPRRVIANEVRDFLTKDGHPPELWAYFGAYDHVALAQLWGKMIDLPHAIPMWTHDLNQLVEMIPGFCLSEQEGTRHNALEDARWVWEMLKLSKQSSVGDFAKTKGYELKDV